MGRSGKRNGQETSGVVCSSIQGKKEFQRVTSNVRQHTEMSKIANAVGVPPIFPQTLLVHAAALPTARPCISLILDFLCFPEPALPTDGRLGVSGS